MPVSPTAARPVSALTALALAGLCSLAPHLAGARSLRAQQRPPAAADSGAPESFGARGMVAISSTTVMHFVLEPNTGGGARIGYVLLIRGAPGWFQRPTGSSTERLTSDIEMQHWSVGEVQYTIGYSAATRRLFAFGQLVNLGREPVVFVTLDAADGEPQVKAGPESRFVMSRPGDFRREFLQATPEVRAFAGLP